MMRVLVLDDDVLIGRLVTRIARSVGFEATAVADPAVFRQHVLADPPQIVVLDLQLGSADGIEQLRFLAGERYAGAVLILSGFDARVLETSGTVARNLGLNVAGTLGKPIQLRELEQILGRLLSARQPLSAESVLAAIRNDELNLEFQPIVTRRPKALKKLEALVRWDHPALGRIAPADFVPVAEARRPVMEALTDWVIGATLEAYAVLRESGVSVPISVNISTQSLEDASFPDRLGQRLGAAAMPASQLCLEITETAASHDPVHTMGVLARVRLMGVQLAIDDFGTGYSSLKALRLLPYSEIKIDRSFVADLVVSRDSRAIVKSIVDLAANMEMSCVAEGVETEATARLLDQLNVGAMQGFLIAAAMPVEAVPAWLAVWMAGDTGPDRGVATASIGDAADSAAPSGGAAEQPLAAAGDPSTLPAGAAGLSSRQLEVMRLLATGSSLKEIARQLDISMGTVKVHLSLAYSALGARNKVEAIVRAGLIPQISRASQ